MDDHLLMDKYELRSHMCRLNRKFRIACRQVVLLNNNICAVKTRYNRANRAGKRSCRYSYRIQLCAYEGVRNMFYEYACLRCDELELLQRKFVTLFGYPFDPSWENSDDDDHSAEDEEDDADGEEEEAATGMSTSNGSTDTGNSKDSLALSAPNGTMECEYDSALSLTTSPSTSSQTVDDNNNNNNNKGSPTLSTSSS